MGKKLKIFSNGLRADSKFKPQWSVLPILLQNGRGRVRELALWVVTPSSLHFREWGSGTFPLALHGRIFFFCKIFST